MIKCRSFLPRMSHLKKKKKFRENKNTRFYIGRHFFFEIPATYEIMWKNIVGPNRPKITIRRMRVISWIPKSRDTHSEYVTQCFSTASTVARTRLNISFYLYCLSCLVIILLHSRFIFMFVVTLVFDCYFGSLSTSVSP
jgi:hypothetical protein